MRFYQVISFTGGQHGGEDFDYQHVIASYINLDNARAQVLELAEGAPIQYDSDGNPEFHESESYSGGYSETHVFIECFETED